MDLRQRVCWCVSQKNVLTVDISSDCLFSYEHLGRYTLLDTLHYVQNWYPPLFTHQRLPLQLCPLPLPP
jgi:hypothetical protein